MDVYYEIEDILYFRDKLEEIEHSLLFDEDASNILVRSIIKEFDKHFNINHELF
jgi:hypothetical protein